jgi:hypothetical protein
MCSPRARFFRPNLKTKVVHAIGKTIINRLWSQTVTMSQFAPLSYTAAPRDESLEAYLMEGLYLLELRFNALDEDGAG